MVDLHLYQCGWFILMNDYSHNYCIKIHFGNAVNYQINATMVSYMNCLLNQKSAYIMLLVYTSNVFSNQ